MRAFLSTLELRDLAFLGGLALIGWGGVQVSAPWTAICVGALLAGLSIPRRAP